MRKWKRGDLVEFDGLLAVVVGIEGDQGVPEDHVTLWFGEPRTTRRSEGGMGGHSPEIWSVPAEDCVPAAKAASKH